MKTLMIALAATALLGFSTPVFASHDEPKPAEQASEQVPPHAARGRTYAYGDPIDRLINGRDVRQERADEFATHEFPRGSRYGRYVHDGDGDGESCHSCGWSRHTKCGSHRHCAAH